MKVLTTQQQIDLLEMISDLESADHNYSPAERATLNYWSIELKPKRVRRKNGLNLNTEEGVIEQAYQEHTGNF